ILLIFRALMLAYTRLGPKKLSCPASQTSWSRSFGRIAQSAMTIATTHKIANNSNWLISLSIVIVLDCRQRLMRSPKVSVPSASCFAYFETPDQERQRQTSQHDQSEQVKTIHEREHR